MRVHVLNDSESRFLLRNLCLSLACSFTIEYYFLSWLAEECFGLWHVLYGGETPTTIMTIPTFSFVVDYKFTL